MLAPNVSVAVRTKLASNIYKVSHLMFTWIPTAATADLSIAHKQQGRTDGSVSRDVDGCGEEAGVSIYQSIFFTDLSYSVVTKRRRLYIQRPLKGVS